MVCVCVSEWPRQVHSFNERWLKTDRSDINIMFAGVRAVCHFLRRQRRKEKKEAGREEKEEGDWGLNKERQRYRTARWRCGEDGAEQIIEACVCVCQESN